MKFIPAFALLSTLAAGVAAAPVSLGDGLLGLDLNKLNACLFADLTKLSLKPNTALDVKSNTCISIDKCLSVKTNEVILKPVLGALLQVGQCQTKVCVAGQVLADTGVCVKACDTGRILDSKGVCVCTQGTIFANSKKLACIATSGCDLKLNTITGGVCLPKVCASGTVLNNAGVCVKSCSTGSILNDRGICVCVEGSIFSNSKKSACIAISKCNLVLNTITNGVCLPKTCATGQVLNNQGACVAKTCAVGRILDGQGVCVCASGTIFSDAKKQVCIATGKCDLTLNTITKGVCLPKVCAAGKLLHSQLGLCIDASTCSLKVNGLCKEVLCPINKRLDANTGLCISLCAKGLLATPNKQCISVSACSTLLNNVQDGNCVPKTCTSKLLSINNEGICVCLPGLGLNSAGTCVTINASK